MKKMAVIILGLTLSGVMALSVNAANRKTCNELKKDRCGERTDCSWVAEHKGKDGKATKAYCKCKGKCAEENKK